MLRTGLFLMLALLTLAWSGAAGAGNHSGTIAKIDKEAGVIVLDEVGPWRVKGGVTEITKRVANVIPSTSFARVTRGPGAGASGWIGDFVEEPLKAWDVKEGDFVTMEARREGKRLVALKVTVVAQQP
jgi:hypothetical protein